jgi:hypothetical protein
MQISRLEDKCLRVQASAAETGRIPDISIEVE